MFKKARWTSLIVTALVLVVASPVTSALAEGPQDGQAPPPVYVQAQPQGYVAPQQQVAEAPPDERGGRGIEYGLHLLVPIFARTPFADSAPGLKLSPGIGLQGRVGWEFPGGLTTELNLGVMYNSVTDGSGFDTSVSLTNVWIGAGLRYSFLNASALVPFVGAGLAVNFWQAQSDFTGTTSDTEAGLGLNALFGFAYEVSPELAIELGAQANYAFATARSVEHSVYFSPFVGGTLYY